MSFGFLVILLCMTYISADGKNETLRLERFSLKEVIPIEGQILTVIPQLGQEYQISFDFKATSLQEYDCTGGSVIELRGLFTYYSGSRNNHTALRIGVSKFNETDDHLRIYTYITFGIDSAWKCFTPIKDYGRQGIGKNEDGGIRFEELKPFFFFPSEWIHVEISQRRIDDERVTANMVFKGRDEDSGQAYVANFNGNPEVLTNVKVYAGSVFQDGLDGSISNFQISTVMDEDHQIQKPILHEDSSAVGLSVSLGLLVMINTGAIMFNV